MDPVRFGLIGYGAWGSHHARAISETSNAELVCIAARSEAAQSLAREAHSTTEIVSDYQELLSRDDLDVVDIVVPTHRHQEIACAALESGRHVLL